MRASILGTMELLRNGRDCTPTGHKPRTVLALLLLKVNTTVPVEWMIEELWEDDPPSTAPSTLQTHVYHLRRALGGGRGPAAGRALLVTRPAGYLLRIDPDDFDVCRFDRLLAEGRAALASGDPEHAAEALRRALAFWRGQALADVVAGPRLRGAASHLEERRDDALELRIQADLRAGRHRELVGELKSLVAVRPYHEWFHGQLMLALSHSGRRNEALEVYQDVRRTLGEDLGLEPSAALRTLHRELLTTGA